MQLQLPKLVTIAAQKNEEVFNGKLHFLCSVFFVYQIKYLKFENSFSILSSDN